MPATRPNFPWVLFLSLTAIAVAASAGAVGATNPDSRWVLPLWVVAALSAVSAVVVVGRWLLLRSPPEASATDSDKASPTLEAEVLALVKSKARTLSELETLTGAAVEFVKAAAEALEAKGRVTFKGSEVSISVTPAVEHDQTLPMWAVKGKPPDEGGHVTRRELVYDTEGRVAGEEIVREMRDAIAKPKTAEAKAEVPTPIVVTGKRLANAPEFPAATIQQASRPGWRASSSVSVNDPHGARLWIDGKETAKKFRCLVREPESGGTVQAFPTGGQVGRHTVHYPMDFVEAPPLREGAYTFEWFGYVSDESNEMFLAGGSFTVNNKLQVFPGGDG